MSDLRSKDLLYKLIELLCTDATPTLKQPLVIGGVLVNVSGTDWSIADGLLVQNSANEGGAHYWTVQCQQVQEQRLAVVARAISMHMTLHPSQGLVRLVRGEFREKIEELKRWEYLNSTSRVTVRQFKVLEQSPKEKRKVEVNSKSETANRNDKDEMHKVGEQLKAEHEKHKLDEQLRDAFTELPTSNELLTAEDAARFLITRISNVRKVCNPSLAALLTEISSDTNNIKGDLLAGRVVLEVLLADSTFAQSIECYDICIEDAAALFSREVLKDFTLRLLYLNYPQVENDEPLSTYILDNDYTTPCIVKVVEISEREQCMCDKVPVGEHVSLELKGIRCKRFVVERDAWITKQCRAKMEGTPWWIQCKEAGQQLQSNNDAAAQQAMNRLKQQLTRYPVFGIFENWDEA